MLKCILGKSGEMVWIELISLRIVTGVAPMWTGQWTSGYIKD
jgi:hypothetical protein